jgi:hypothetical protein
MIVFVNQKTARTGMLIPDTPMKSAALPVDTDLAQL